MRGIVLMEKQQGGYGTPRDLGPGAWSILAIVGVFFFIAIIIPAISMFMPDDTADNNLGPDGRP